MKIKNLTIASLALATIATGVATTGANASANMLQNKYHTTNVYHFNKKHSKITKVTKAHKSFKVNHKKTVTVKHVKYTYNPKLKGFVKLSNLKSVTKHKKTTTNDEADNYFKYVASQANKPNGSYHNPKSHKSHENNTKHDHIVDGFNEDTSYITNMDEYLKVVRQTALQKANEFRTSHGSPALTETKALDDIAQERAEKQQVPYGFGQESWYDGHKDQNGQYYVDKIAVKNGLYNNYNEADSNLSENTGNYASPVMESAKQEGNDIIQQDIDEGPSGGHYQNLLDASAKKVGIGFAIGKQKGDNTQNGNVIDFSN